MVCREMNFSTNYTAWTITMKSEATEEEDGNLK